MSLMVKLINAMVAAGIVAAGVGTAWYIARPTESSGSGRIETVEAKVLPVEARIPLENAKKNPQIRQRYLDDLLKGVNILNCEGVVYDGDGKKFEDYMRKLITARESDPIMVSMLVDDAIGHIKGGDCDANTPEIFEESMEKTPIFIGRWFFDNSGYSEFNEADIKSIIVYHEGRHAWRNAHKFKLTNEMALEIRKNKKFYDVLYILGEIDAIVNEINHVSPGNGRNYVRCLEENYLSRGSAVMSACAAPVFTERQKGIILETLEEIRGQRTFK